MSEVNPVPFRLLDWGFQFGSATITRTCSDHKEGWVVINLDTPKGSWDLYVTKTGKVRIYNKQTGEELTK